MLNFFTLYWNEVNTLKMWMRGGKDIKELTVVQVVGVVRAGDIGLVGGKLGVVTLDLGVS